MADNLLKYGVTKKFVFDEAAKRTDVKLTRMSADFFVKTEAAVRKYIADYIATTPFSGKTIS